MNAVGATCSPNSPKAHLPGEGASSPAVGEGGFPFEPGRVRDNLALRARWKSTDSGTCERLRLRSGLRCTTKDYVRGVTTAAGPIDVTFTATLGKARARRAASRRISASAAAVTVITGESMLN